MAKRNRRAEWYEVDRAIRQAWADKPEVRAIDPAAMASRRSWARPNPNRQVTVRPTGSEGAGPLPRDPLDAIDRARMRALVEKLPRSQGEMAVAAAFGWIPMVARAKHVRPETLYDLADEGRRQLRMWMVAAGLMDAA